MGANSRSSAYLYHWEQHIVVLVLRLKALKLGRVDFSLVTYVERDKGQGSITHATVI